MYRRFNLRALLLASLLASACGDPSESIDDDQSSANQDDHDQDQDHEVSNEQDAGGGPSVPSEGRDAATSSEPDAAPAAQRDGGTHVDAGLPADAGRGNETGRGNDAGRGDDAGRGNDAGSVRDASADTGAGDACSTLTYASFGQSFMQQYCVSCHGTPSTKGIELDTLAKVHQRKAKVKSEVSAMGMPEKGAPQPSAAERQKLIQWIDCGAK